jgi:hypothetical protein
MTRKDTRNTSVLRGTAPFIVVLTVMIALAALAQTGGSQVSVKPSVALATSNSGAPQRESNHPLRSEEINGRHVPASREARKRHPVFSQVQDSPLFLPVANFYSGGFASSVAVADVNGDGKPDLAVANDNSNPTGSVSILLGNGDGTFQPAVTYNSGGQSAISIVIANLNGDAKPDLVVLNASGTLGVLRGNGDGTFRAVVTYGTGGTSPTSVAVADLNGDGKLDLVVTNQTGGNDDVVGVLIGNGDGTFKAAVAYSSGGFLPSSVAVSDINGDGKPDLIVTSYCTGNNSCPGEGVVGVLLGNGNGTFQSAVVYDTGGIEAKWVAVADVNGDGRADVVVANCGPSGSGSCGAGTLGVLLGNGDGTLLPVVTYDTGGDFPNSVAVADVNGDGKRDVVVVNSFSLGVLLGNGNGTFQPPQTYNYPGGFPGETGESIAITDVSGDGRPDLLVADGGIGLLLNIDAPSTTTTVISNANPVPINQTVTYTAAVKNQSGGALTGKVMFQDGGAIIATVALAGTQAAYSTSYGVFTSRQITATYLGDFNNAASISNTLTEYIGSSFRTRTGLSTSGSPSFIGQAVTFTANVSPSVGTVQDGEPVTFYDGLTPIGTGTTVNNVATFTTSALMVKTHFMKAVYPGDAVFAPSSGKVKQIVIKYPTTTTLSSSLNPSQFGQKVTFTVQVTGSGPPLTGHVRLLDGTLGIGSATLSGGVAKITKSTLAVGTHPITAQYVGDAYSAKSTSPVVNQVVQ